MHTGPADRSVQQLTCWLQLGSKSQHCAANLG